MLAILGKFFWPIIGGLVPWGGPKFGLFLAGLLGAVVLIGGPAGYVWLNMRGEVKAAVIACNSQCKLKLANMETAAERTISDILSSVNEEGQSSESVAEYCKRNPGLCRTEGGQ